MRRIVLAICVIALALPLIAADSECPAAWGYEPENGPNRWGQMRKEWAVCDTGIRQSPIVITQTTRAELPEIKPRYGRFPLVVQNTAHEIKVPVGAGSLVWGTVTAPLVQFHFHVPAEHQIPGVQADAELHLVHRLSENKLLVLGILIRKGDPNPALEPITALAPPVACTSAKSTDEYVLLNTLVSGNLHSYATYEGSLTTPACDQTVTWLVLTTPISASEGQIKKLTVAHGEHGNARPTQPRNGRAIREQ